MALNAPGKMAASFLMAITDKDPASQFSIPQRKLNTTLIYLG
jgi:hypothetical protein